MSARGDVDLLDLDLVGAAEAIRTRQASSVEVTSACIRQVERLQPTLNCFISVEPDEALAAARRADDEIGRGVVRGPLHGVPLAHKDMLYRAGRVSTCGSKIRKDFTPGYTATVHARLDAAGAVNLGTLNMSEFAFGPTGHNAHWGHCRNPWNPEHITGGSSSGSGSAVAGRLVYGALGSDTGGSVRLPAGICGLAGLKPTQARVSRYGVMPLSFSLDQVGPLARSVRDCARLLSVIAGFDPQDPTSSTIPIEDYESRLSGGARGIRIGVPTSHFYEGIADDVRACIEKSLEIYRSLGAEIVEVTVPHLDVLDALSNIVMTSEAATIHGEWLRTRPGDYQEQVRHRIMAGLFYPATKYIEALDLRPKITADVIEAVFSRADVLHAPLLHQPVPRIDDTDLGGSAEGHAVVGGLTRLTRPLNYLGLPGLSVPAGFSDNGLPVAFQLLGRPFAESMLLRLGHAFQSETDWHRRRPSLAGQDE
jgi:aspartyl-tRNA(Asn)/glutamyl-tRNA(Gln) amidotransferase subunit A